MDNDLIQLVARLKIRLRQQKQQSLNAQRFFDEPAYANQILDNTEQSADIELALMAMELREHLDWKSQPQSDKTGGKTVMPYAPARHGMMAADASRF
ncbi:MAG TPA: hypothetical protein VFW00_12785 [Rhodocyclaceae bacterium]|nr:hypothetical protein [Rhodocyclaceae bacterium]